MIGTKINNIWRDNSYTTRNMIKIPSVYFQFQWWSIPPILPNPNIAEAKSNGANKRIIISEIIINGKLLAQL